VLEDEVSRARLLAALGRHNADEPELAELLRTSDAPDVLDEIARQRRILATALANAVNVLNPAVVVLGGFLAMLAEHDPSGLRQAVVSQTMPANGEDLEIRAAALAEDRLLIGAAEAAFAELLRDPSVIALR
jgi:predicted NBD/HSP70 family sugar kinase